MPQAGDADGGVPRAAACPSCGAPVDGTMRFCTRCGAALATPAHADAPAGTQAVPDAAAASDAPVVPIDEPSPGAAPIDEVSSGPEPPDAEPSGAAAPDDAMASSEAVASDGATAASGAMAASGATVQAGAPAVPPPASPTEAMPLSAVVPSSDMQASPDPASAADAATSVMPPVAPYGSSPMPPAAAYSSATPSAAAPSAVVPPSAVSAAYRQPSGTPGAVAYGSASTPSAARGGRNGVIAALVAVIVVLVAAIGVGAWWFVFRDDGSASSGAGDQIASDTSAPGGDADADADSSGSDSADDGDASATPTSCSAAPSASLESVGLSGTSLVADIALTSDDCGDLPFEESGVRVTIKDDSGNVVADAVYDFSDAPIEFDGGEATARLAFGIGQYWRPHDQIDAASAQVGVQTGAAANGAPAAGAGSALGGANVPDADIERNAQFALSWQREHDRAAAGGFYTTYTTQLSSKKYGMQVEGKTWDYGDIYAQFLEKRARHPKALLVWSGDYPTYQKNGTTDYYVILSGEGFGSAADANAWCSANGYTTDDCLAIDLQ